MLHVKKISIEKKLCGNHLSLSIYLDKTCHFCSGKLWNRWITERDISPSNDKIGFRSRKRCSSVGQLHVKATVCGNSSFKTWSFHWFFKNRSQGESFIHLNTRARICLLVYSISLIGTELGEGKDHVGLVICGIPRAWKRAWLTAGTQQIFIWMNGQMKKWTNEQTWSYQSSGR